MKYLHIHIGREWPEKTLTAPWYLLDARGALISRGLSDPRHWPGANNDQEYKNSDVAVKLILTEGQVSYYPLRLPNGKAAQRPEVLQSAVEEFLLQNIEDCLLLTGETSDGITDTFITSRQRTNLILKVCREFGFEPESLVSDGQMLPLREGARVSRLYGTSLMLARGKSGFLHLDLPQPLNVLDVLTKQEIEKNGLSVAENAVVPSGFSTCKLFKEKPNEYPLSQENSRGFLIGDYAKKRSAKISQATVVPAVRLAAAFALICLVLFSIEWKLLDHRVSELKETTRNYFLEAFPEATVVDPVLQIKRQIESKQDQLGLLGSSDLISMLEKFSTMPRMRLIKIDYSHGTIEADVLVDASIRGLANYPPQGYKIDILEEKIQADGKYLAHLRMVTIRGN